MKRRLFLAATAIAGSGVAANANTVSKVGHYVNLQTLTTTQRVQLSTFQKNIYAGLANYPQGRTLAKQASSLTNILSRNERDGDYELVFLNEFNNKITLKQSGGKSSVLIEA